MNCRHCCKPLQHTFLDLGFAPPSNSYLNESELSAPEVYFPLKLKVCDHCWLVQTEDYAQADLFFLQGLCLFLVDFNELAGARSGLFEGHDHASRSGK